MSGRKNEQFKMYQRDEIHMFFLAAVILYIYSFLYKNLQSLIDLIYVLKPILIMFSLYFSIMLLSHGQFIEFCCYIFNQCVSFILMVCFVVCLVLFFIGLSALKCRYEFLYYLSENYFQNQNLASVISCVECIEIQNFTINKKKMKENVKVHRYIDGMNRLSGYYN